MNIGKRTESEIKKHTKGLCKTPYCKNKHQQKSWTCKNCKNDIKIKNNPLKYTYGVLKNNAKRRGKEFTLTFEYFEKLAKQNDYMNKKGTKSKSLHIDRVDESKGYSDDNVRCITLRQNVMKYARYKKTGGTLEMEAGF